MLEALQQNNTSGYIVLDKTGKFIVCNDIASSCISELGDCPFDKIIANENHTFFWDEWIKEFDMNADTAHWTYSTKDYSWNGKYG